MEYWYVFWILDVIHDLASRLQNAAESVATLASLICFQSKTVAST